MFQERERIAELLGENARLENDLRQSTNKIVELGDIIQNQTELKLINDYSSTNLAAQLADTERSNLLELQLENRKLRSQLEESTRYE